MPTYHSLWLSGSAGLRWVELRKSVRARRRADRRSWVIEWRRNGWQQIRRNQIPVPVRYSHAAARSGGDAARRIGAADGAGRGLLGVGNGRALRDEVGQRGWGGWVGLLFCGRWFRRLTGWLGADWQFGRGLAGRGGLAVRAGGGGVAA